MFKNSFAFENKICSSDSFGIWQYIDTITMIYSFTRCIYQVFIV